MSLWEEIENILQKDPAARSWLEVCLCYPGLHALLIHRIAYQLWHLRFRTLARFISQLARMLTGIEIHPAAKIGKRVMIDHGMGVVIGETAEVGDDTVLYQGVTLGAGKEAREGALTRGVKRHPTLGRGVVVGSGAEIQGAITVGDNARIASGSIVLKDVPPDSVVVGVPARLIYKEGKRVEEVDLEALAVKSMQKRIEALEQRLDKLSQESLGVGDTISDTAKNRFEEDSLDVFLPETGI